MDRPFVSVLVNTYQRPLHLRRCLLALARQTIAKQMEVVVVDDGSRDETEAVVRGFARTAPFPVKFLTHPHDAFQLCRCRNEGAQASTADRLVFLDGDLLAPPGHIAEHVRHLAPGTVTNSYVAYLSEEVTRGIDEGAVKSGEFTRLAPPSELAKLTAMSRKNWFYQHIRKSTRPRCKGGDLGVMRSDYEKLNGFDENFRAWGGEDDDFGFRLRSAKIQLKFILKWTFSYHMWHPLSPSRPDKLKNGENETYLHRPVRLTHCMNGLTKRTMRDLQVRLCGVPADEAPLARALRVHFKWPQLPQGGRADVEVLPFPGTGRFTSAADARLLLVTQRNAQVPAQILKQANIVLSPLGDIGREGQLRLRLEDQAPLADSLGFRPIASAPALRRAA